MSRMRKNPNMKRKSLNSNRLTQMMSKIPMAPPTGLKTRTKKPMIRTQKWTT